MKKAVETVLGIKLQNRKNVVIGAIVVGGSGAEDDRGLDVASLAPSKLFFLEGTFLIVIFWEFVCPDIFHDEKEIGLDLPNVSGFVDKRVIGNFF